MLDVHPLRTALYSVGGAVECATCNTMALDGAELWNQTMAWSPVWQCLAAARGTCPGYVRARPAAGIVIIRTLAWATCMAKPFRRGHLLR